ncbi:MULTISPECIES: hypothetical protein [unclassified Pseudoxanthomonas]|uniref:hypothetical protein n=1 Tax=unclassified Pseudoxanthomonas TaxID=2645906 RepID=UPI00160B9D83|nr:MULTISPECIES: hypothetical protein [unclassified Pseudoxanthomonas]MBB3275430.1 hypothetical protein [Pseudoxanthomonas sp. OG2]MBV7473480.1 hypothetical protein [Pseudoxanthomonas sp. PXM05]
MDMRIIMRQFPTLFLVRTALALLAVAIPLSSQAARLEYVTAVDGTITDVTPQRILFFVIEDGRPLLKVYNRATGSLRTVPDPTGHTPGYEKLTARGVVYGITEDDETSVYEWNGAAAPLGNDGTPRGMRVSPNNKRYVIWPTWRPGRYLNLRDVMLYKDTLVGNGRVADLADVGDGGEVVYTEGPAPYNVFRYRAGQAVQLTHDPTYSHFNPLTDGINVVYRKQVSTTASQIVLYNDNLGEVVLRDASSDYFTPRADYFPSSGWVGFTRLNTVNGNTVRQVWLRSPQGQLTAVSRADADASIHAIAGGQVMFVSNGYLYLGRPGAAPVLVSPFAEGTGGAWLQGSWYVYFGGTLYRVVL